MTQLETLQQAFAAALDNPAADAALSAWLQPPTQSSDAQAQPQDERLHARIGLYRGNVRAARRNALANAYPVLAALGGDAWFDALALAYARAHPTRDADLNRFGAALPAFVEHYETNSRYAYFGDVARLEWALHVAAFAANVTPLTVRQWNALGAERLASARLRVHPACTAWASAYAVDAIWRAHQPHAHPAPAGDARAWPARIDTPSWYLVVRPQWQATLLTHTEAAHVAFVSIQRGATLDEALDAAFTADPAFDFASQWRTWIECGALVGLRDD
ncbi:DNA-binding domain-containing protein [Paraburkholderia sp. J12]|uniref:DNA-binding domain-containing protein n=1 Tax=Paraburkholderia sp. J12 TaxID=2805432 RepID=UPI002ABE57F3|nr:DNA-binding domain-containing protein [Paraburkholderia sp. J12]